METLVPARDTTLARNPISSANTLSARKSHTKKEPYTDEELYTDEKKCYHMVRTGKPEAHGLLQNATEFELAGGPDGETVWHAVVLYYGDDNEALELLSCVPKDLFVKCDTVNGDGETPLMLASRLEKTNMAIWLSEHSDLNLVNPKTGQTALEIIAKCQILQSVEVFRTMMNCMLLDHQGQGRARRIPFAIWKGWQQHEKCLRSKMRRQDKDYAGDGQGDWDYSEYLAGLSEAARIRDQTFEIYEQAMGEKVYTNLGHLLGCPRPESAASHNIFPTSSLGTPV
ncbi:hypothetical protein N7470_000596 [Penicillium chermesinum]|nr:hypothetical protein N7470_000596 [Penicillium chermesinum]